MHMYDDPFIVISGSMAAIAGFVMLLLLMIFSERRLLWISVAVPHSIAQFVVLIVFWMQEGSFIPLSWLWIFAPVGSIFFAFACAIKLSQRPCKKTDPIWPNPNNSSEDPGGVIDAG